MNNPPDKTKILLDSDVIRNFERGNKLNILAKIFPNRFCIIDRVKNELFRSKWLKNTVEQFISKENIEEIKFPSDNYDILLEYSKLLSDGLGDGESACLSFARYEKTYISSSNLKDVFEYCKKHKIKNIPTMELLREAIAKKVMTEIEVDIFIEKCIKQGAKLPAKSWKEYEKNN